MNLQSTRARLSLNTGAFPPEQCEEALRWVAALEVDGFELSPEHAHKIWTSPALRATALELVASAGITPLSVHAWGEVESLPDVCPFTEEISAGLVVVHCRDALITGDFDTQVRELQHWHDWCKARGIVLTVENSSIQPLEPFVRLFEAVPELRMTLDIKHAYKPERLGLTHVDYMAALGDRVANFHISGIDPERDELGDGIPPGDDRVDWRAIAADLARRGYSGNVTIEWSYPRHLGAERIEEVYRELPVGLSGAESVSQRAAAWCVRYFREQFGAVLG